MKKGKRLSGAQLIQAERVRQIRSEGYHAAADDSYVHHQLVSAAFCYASTSGPPVLRGHPIVPASWPWNEKYWKPSKDPVRNLTKAGALIAAEIDRLQRLKTKRGGGA